MGDALNRGFDITNVLPNGNFANYPSFPSPSHINATYVTGEALQFGRILGPGIVIAEITAAVAAVNPGHAITGDTDGEWSALAGYAERYQAGRDYLAGSGADFFGPTVR